MRITELSGELAWQVVSFYVIQNKSFKSVTGITYDAKLVADEISYIGGSGNRGTVGESISKVDFVAGFNAIKTLTEINTNTIKEFLPNSLYRKRTPFIALLYSASLII